MTDEVTQALDVIRKLVDENERLHKTICDTTWEGGNDLREKYSELCELVWPLVDILFEGSKGGHAHTMLLNCIGKVRVLKKEHGQMKKRLRDIADVAAVDALYSTD